MSAAKAVSMSVRPLQASHLCFEVGGILAESKVQLGAQVTAFDFAAFYLTLMSFPTSLVLGDLSRLIYDSFEIRNFVESSLLAALRAEDRKAALNKAINARQNAYKAKYVNIPDIVSRMIQDYSPSTIGSKPNRLWNLRQISQQQADALQAAYSSDKRTGVVKSTNSSLDSTLGSKGTSRATGHRDGQSIDKNADFWVEQATFPAPPIGAAGPAGGGDYPTKEDIREGRSSEDSSDNVESTGSATEHQDIANTDYAYRIPFLESQAQNERAQISLTDEAFTQFMAGQSVANLGFPDLSKIFTNELSSIDYDVFQLQVAYLNSILMSPIPGIVTGVYKNPGDAVAAGEPVVRVENNAEILIVATLIFRGPIAIGSSVKINTKLFDLAGPLTPIAGPVVAARGLREDDHWEVIVKCNNIKAGKPIFPLGYHFDYDDTTVDIS